MSQTDWATAFSWALDFCRAVRERPWWARWLFRFVIGRYAYREFIGLQDALKREGFLPYFPYELEDLHYHADPVPVAWWEDREPIPRKEIEQ